LRQQLREGDRLFRYAGDEFVALISRGDAVAASLVSDRLSAAVGAHEFEVPGEGGAILTLNLHVSIGIAICPDQASTREEILEMADRALYRVKRPVSAGLSVEVSGAAAAAHAMGLS
jgi:diguanylate cyclase (GGDEF)-like protein